MIGERRCTLPAHARRPIHDPRSPIPRPQGRTTARPQHRPTPSPHHRPTASPHHRITASPHHPLTEES
ncbi:hypothetical protein CIK71_03070 [Brachybacterium alimentarium]|nr:hypothetical protein CIK71_03070 [Brachybacterium alimentarium]